MRQRIFFPIFAFLGLVVFVSSFKTTSLFAENGTKDPGTFGCKKVAIAGTGGQYFLCELDSTKNDCKTGFKPGNCRAFDNVRQECDKTFSCIPQGTEVPDCIFSYFGCEDPYPIRCQTTYNCCKTVDQCGTLLEQKGAVNVACVVEGKEGVKTALGCIPVNNLNDFVAWFLEKALFIATGIAFLLMAFGAIQILTSAGNPDKVKAGGELITSAVSGLLLIILSAFLLKLIGVDILHIPGFAK